MAIQWMYNDGKKWQNYSDHENKYLESYYQQGKNGIQSTSGQRKIMFNQMIDYNNNHQFHMQRVPHGTHTDTNTPSPYIFSKTETHSSTRMPQKRKAPSSTWGSTPQTRSPTWAQRTTQKRKPAPTWAKSTTQTRSRTWAQSTTQKRKPPPTWNQSTTQKKMI